MPEVAPGPIRTHANPPGGHRPLTAERYISEAWLQREFDQLWPNLWHFACLERDVANPGEYAVWNIGRESIIIARTEEGTLAANYNVCQHRGARIVTNERGCSKSLTCQYHMWSYRPDGRLVVVPDNQRFPGGVDRAARSLKPVKVATMFGLVFVNMNPNCAPLDEYLGDLVDLVSPYQIEKMAFTSEQTVSLNCNWKAVFDNFHELYHVDYIHPLHGLQYDCPRAAVDLFDKGHTAVQVPGGTVNTRLPIPHEPTPVLARRLEMAFADPTAYHGRVLDIRDDLQRLRRETGARRGWDYTAMSDDQLSDVLQYNGMPNLMITVQADDAMIMRARPHPTDPNWCWWDKFAFHRQPDPAVAEKAGVPFEPWDANDLQPVARPAHEFFDQDDIIAGRKTLGRTMDEDVHFIRDVQAGMHSRGFDTAILNSDEARVQHYHAWLDHWMGVV